MLNIFRPKDELAGNTIKQCPYCKGFVRGNEVKCKHCKNFIKQKKTASDTHKNKDSEPDSEDKGFSL